MSSNRSGLNKLLIGGLITGVIGFGLYLNNKKKSDAPKILKSRDLSKEEILKILNDLYKNFFTPCQEQAQYIQKMSQMYRGQVKVEDLREFVATSPQFIELIKSVEKQVYAKYKITEQEFQNAIENNFKTDEDVMMLTANIKKQYDDSLKGVMPDAKSEIPEFLTKEKTLDILKQIFQLQQNKIKEALNKLKEEGLEINFHDPKVNQVLQNIKMEEVKERVLKENNLDDFDDPAEKILHYAIQKFSQEDHQFSQSYMNLEMGHQKAFEQILHGSMGGSM